MKSTITHVLAFAAGLATGAIVVTKGCPPSPTPGSQPPTAQEAKVEEPKKIEAKVEEKKVEDPTKAEVKASPAAEVKPQ